MIRVRASVAFMLENMPTERNVVNCSNIANVGLSLDPYKKKLVSHDRTTTTLENGKAAADTVHDKQHVGVGIRPPGG